jgi:hypothetical protein
LWMDRLSVAGGKNPVEFFNFVGACGRNFQPYIKYDPRQVERLN